MYTNNDGGNSETVCNFLLLVKLKLFASLETLFILPHKNPSYHSFLPWLIIKRISRFCHSSPPLKSNSPSLLIHHLLPPSWTNTWPRPSCHVSSTLTGKIHTLWTKDRLPCCLPPAGLPEQKNKSSNSLRWWGVNGNISVYITFKPHEHTSLFPYTP